MKGCIVLANIQITPELLQQKSSELRKLRGNHDSNMNSLTNLVRGVNEVWKGEAQNAFVSKFESMQVEFKKFSELLEMYAVLMDTAAQEFANTDSSLKSTMQNFG